ncbi:endonuclease 2 [Micractinium conductrix]|uniref:Endonuclease 2 n=1 Tax=Micractinium conductrix TaxID=554055 RepID=A0A2P6V6I5_9CHLO|nr:endonuclease 2 [Micractinium conductrix]|eukprot:PSC69703.1 endonuclease 2 [Micractinium conductrix]
MGAEVALRCTLPVGRSRAESEALLQQTAEAQQALLDFKGAFDVRRAVEAAQQGRVLHPMVLGAVASTLGAAARLAQRLQPQGGAQSFAALQQLAAGIGDALPQLQQTIERCIQPQEGRILESASPALAEVRQARRQNRDELRAEMDRWARQLHALGVSERPQVVVRRDRLCIPVRAGRQGELPKGSVSLATSASGNTLYMEPAPAVKLNNAEMQLAAREAEEETAVLVALTELVGQHALQLRALLASITALDVAAARGQHASWLGATQPPRFLSAEEAAVGGAVQLPRAWHPLLLQPCLPPPPAPPLTKEMQQLMEASAAPSGPMSDLSLVPELAIAAAPKPVGEIGGSVPKRGSSGSSDGSGSRAKPPQPVDLTVPAGIDVVAVTGPNTGGKTASLKTLGLQCLMAKAGLFQPQAPSEQQQQQQQAAGGQQQQRQQPGAGRQPQALLWFDRVLADLGDGQSLQQSLSTFSGHVRRIRNVLAAATPQSLVLLDEVGSGTDPAEGAALASALLEQLQRRTALTYATTHHAELKELASTTPGFVNASVEFDIASLRPTYRLQWGAAGESNALAVAQGLGFAPAVVAAAREVAQQLHHGGHAAGQRSQMLQASLVEQLDEARAAAGEAATARATAEAAAAAAQAELEAAHQQQAALGKAAAAAKKANAEAAQRVQRLLTEVRTGRRGAREAEEQLRGMEREAAPPEAAAMRLLGLRAAAKGGAGSDTDDGAGSDGGSAAAAGWTPAEGDSVRVLKMGGAVGTVAKAAPTGRTGGKVSVRVGALTVELRVSDLAPASSPAGLQAAASGTRAGSARGGGGGGGGSLKAAAKQLRARGSLDSGDEEDLSPQGVAIQTSRNTVDVRGRTGDDAASEVQAALLSAPSGWVLFVVHGVGTGRVRQQVRALLKGHPRVAKTEEAEASNGGCTLVYVR